MVKKVILYLGIFLMAFSPAAAETVTQKEASRIAETFFNAANGRIMAKPKLVYNGRKLTTDRLFSPFYVYNHPTVGYVVISAENKAFPILAYDLKNNFDPDNADIQTMSMLKGYAKDIEHIRYDDRIPYEAINAWQNLPRYIDDVLNATYEATDPIIEIESVDESIDEILDSDNFDSYYSDIYTPSQWQDIMNENLKTFGNVALGLIVPGDVVPVIVHGRKGDFYRLAADKPNGSLMRLTATEYLNPWQLAAFENVTHIVEEPIEEPSFALYDDFLIQTRSENEERMAMFEERVNPTEPKIYPAGGGKYTINLPEQVALARIYNLNGSLVRQQKFGQTDSAVITLEGLPYGFYFVLLNGQSGKSYGFKLSR